MRSPTAVVRRAMVPLTLFAAACGAARPAEAPAPRGVDVVEASIAELRRGMENGRYTSADLTRAYLARIDALDPRLNAMLDLNPAAIAIADSLDAERRAGRVRGPLHGIPIVIKDNVATHDGMTTTAGALALTGSVAPRDAFIVERLRAAGAVIVGKTNLSEWANFRSTHSSSGWSGRGGQTRNPYALDRSPCGSSSGTGAAVAASLAAAGVGTETDGSIVCPSAAMGLVGVKPTVGLVSRTGIIPISASQDVAGPMARTVEDAAILLGAMAGADPADPVTAGARDHAEADYTRFLDADGLRGARIGVARKGVTGYSPATDSLFGRALDELRAAGAVVVDSVDFPHMGEYDAAEFTILLYEFRDGVNRYLEALGPAAPVHSLADVIAYNRAHAATSMPFFGQELLEMAQAKGPLTDDAYRAALDTARLAAEGIDRALREHRLDAIVAPTGGPAWTIDRINGDHFLGASSTPAAVAGYPSVTVPMGAVYGLPVGLAFVGTAWSEPALLRLAYAYEQATRHREPPRLLPTVAAAE